MNEEQKKELFKLAVFEEFVSGSPLDYDELPNGVEREEADKWVSDHRDHISEAADKTWGFWESLTPET